MKADATDAATRATILGCALIVAIEAATHETPERFEDGKALVAEITAEITAMLDAEEHDSVVPFVIAYLKAGVLSTHDFRQPQLNCNKEHQP